VVKLPKKVMVCGVEWTVEYMSTESTEQGRCDYVKTTIFIREGLSHERTMETFLHELGHAVAEESGYHYLMTSPGFQNFDSQEQDEILTRVFVRAYLATLGPLLPDVSDGLYEPRVYKGSKR